MRVKLRTTPGLHEEWHSIARVHTDRRTGEVAEPPAETGSGVTDGSIPPVIA